MTPCRQAEESARLNPRALVLPSDELPAYEVALRTGLESLEHSALYLRGLTRSIIDSTRVTSEASPVRDAETRSQLADVLRPAVGRDPHLRPARASPAVRGHGRGVGSSRRNWRRRTASRTGWLSCLSRTRPSTASTRPSGRCAARSSLTWTAYAPACGWSPFPGRGMSASACCGGRHSGRRCAAPPTAARLTAMAAITAPRARAGPGRPRTPWSRSRPGSAASCWPGGPPGACSPPGHGRWPPSGRAGH